MYVHYTVFVVRVLAVPATSWSSAWRFSTSWWRLIDPLVATCATVFVVCLIFPRRMNGSFYKSLSLTYSVVDLGPSNYRLIPGYISRGISPRVYLPGYISRGISPVVYLPGYISQGISPGVYLPEYISQRISPGVLLPGYISRGISTLQSLAKWLFILAMCMAMASLKCFQMRLSQLRGHANVETINVYSWQVLSTLIE